MSEYIPLAIGEEADPHTAPFNTGARVDMIKEHLGVVRSIAVLRRVLIITLVVINILVWVGGLLRLRYIYYTLKELVDPSDTRVLPRPDVHNGLNVS